MSAIEWLQLLYLFWSRESTDTLSKRTNSNCPYDPILAGQKKNVHGAVDCGPVSTNLELPKLMNTCYSHAVFDQSAQAWPQIRGWKKLTIGYLNCSSGCLQCLPMMTWSWKVLLAACSMWPLIKLHRHDPPKLTERGGGGLPVSISRLGLVWSLRWESPVIAIYSCPGMGNLESHINLACFTTITAQMPIFLTVRYTMWPSIPSSHPPP